MLNILSMVLILLQSHLLGSLNLFFVIQTCWIFPLILKYILIPLLTGPLYILHILPRVLFPLDSVVVNYFSSFKSQLTHLLIPESPDIGTLSCYSLTEHL